MPKILIVEDEKMLSEMYQDRFEAEGIKVFAAFSAEEALEKLNKESPDLILLDILLPRANGIEFVEKLKEKKHGFEIPIVAFSNYDDAQTKVRAAQLGIKEYLIKTQYTPTELVAKVKEYLKG